MKICIMTDVSHGQVVSLGFVLNVDKCLAIHSCSINLFNY